MQDPEDTIKEVNQEYELICVKAMIFLCHHLHKGLKTGYLIVKNSLELKKNKRRIRSSKHRDSSKNML